MVRCVTVAKPLERTYRFQAHPRLDHCATALSAQVACPHCGGARRHKDSRPIVMRTLFGTLCVDSPRWWHCGCLPQVVRMFSPREREKPGEATFLRRWNIFEGLTVGRGCSGWVR
jgi:hypothetical protein